MTRRPPRAGARLRRDPRDRRGGHRRPDGPGPIESTLLLLVAIVFLVTGRGRRRSTSRIDDAPPPRWMAMVAAAGPSTRVPARCGAGGREPEALGVHPRRDRRDRRGRIWTGRPQRSARSSSTRSARSACTSASSWRPSSRRARWMSSWIAFSAALERYDRPIMIAVSLVFGVWFLLKALDGFGRPVAAARRNPRVSGPRPRRGPRPRWTRPTSRVPPRRVRPRRAPSSAPGAAARPGSARRAGPRRPRSHRPRPRGPG